MNTASPAPTLEPAPHDPSQKRRVIIGVVVWVVGWALSLAMIPVVHSTDLGEGVKKTIDGILLLGCPKLFLFIAVAIMGKPGFAYLKSLVSGHFRRFAPPATVSPLRYKLGLILLVTMIVLGSLGPYVAHDAFAFRQEHPRMLAFMGDLLLFASLFILGGDFWDKLRALFIREAKVVFPEK